MTQVKGAQQKHREVAWTPRADGRTLAQRRADLEAQVRAMALSDLKQVSDRLKALRAELSAQEGREVTQQEVADQMKLSYRTFQSWEGGEVENRDGKGYDKIARYYSRKLGRKITRKWIVFGDGEARPVEAAPQNGSEPSQLDRIEMLLTGMDERQQRLEERQSYFFSLIEAARAEGDVAETPSPAQDDAPPARRSASKDKSRSASR